MVRKFTGGVINKTAPVTTGGKSGSASGVWSTAEALQKTNGSLWPQPKTVPNAPTIGAVTNTGVGTVSVSFSAPVDNGGSAITSYTVTSSPGGIITSGASAPITVSGLSNGTAYTFTVTATNAIGTSAPSSASSSVTTWYLPGAPIIGTATNTGPDSATVAFTAPADTGGTAITSYTVTSSPGGVTATGTTSPITITGLSVATNYTFTVTATNPVGTGPSSASSNSIFTTYSIEYLVVAGGGGGANLYYGSRGGAGAGGVTVMTGYNYTSFPSKTLNITVGAGGGLDSNGGDSYIMSSSTQLIRSYGGGNGYIPTVGGCGSGGTYRYGGSGSHAPTGASGQSGVGSGGTVTAYFTSGGNAWGLGGSNLLYGGGGGGASANGASATSSAAGAGGNGVYLANWAQFGKDTANPGYFAGGGAGGVYQSTSSRLDGSDTRAPGGGGAAAGMTKSKVGTTNSGGGGGAGNGGENSRQVGGTGGSGIVVVRYPGSQKATGGSVSSSGGYTYHEFTSSGTLVFN